MREARKVQAERRGSAFRWLGHKLIMTTVDLCGHLAPEASGRALDGA
jgi:hypothetical protein